MDRAMIVLAGGLRGYAALIKITRTPFSPKQVRGIHRGRACSTCTTCSAASLSSIRSTTTVIRDWNGQWCGMSLAHANPELAKVLKVMRALGLR